MAGPDPLYGMCCILMPALWLNISPMMCCGVPEPAEAKLILSPFLARAIRSLMEVMPEAGLASTTKAALATGATKVKSAIGW